jgi:two-component system, NtrC family, sensor kinase
MSFEASTIGGDRSVEQLRRELAEAREQQAATAEILRVISSSPTDLQRAFSEIAASAARLCEADDAMIRQMEEGGFLRLVAHYGSIPATAMGVLTRGFLAGRAVLDGRTVQVADVPADTDEYPEGSDIARRLGFRTNLAVPLIRAGAAIGVINIRRTEARLFSDKQIALLESFADQAVIAIENARLFEAEQARSRQLTESLRRQTATADVLKVISRSAFDLRTVLETLTQSVAQLCEADVAGLATVCEWQRVFLCTRFRFFRKGRSILQEYVVSARAGEHRRAHIVNGRCRSCA